MSSIVARPIQLLLAVLVVSAAGSDLRARRVPNWITIPGLVLAIALNTVLPHGSGWRSSLLGLVAASAVYLIFFALRAMGAGDVKLMAAVGAAVGPANWFLIFVVTALFGGVAAVGTILVRKRTAKTLRNIGTIAASAASGQAPFRVSPELDVRDSRSAGLPHAVAIACGTLTFLLGQVLGK